LHQEQSGDQLFYKRVAGRKKEISDSERQYENDRCEETRRINATEPRPQKPTYCSPASVLVEAMSIHMGQNEAAEEEKKIDSKRSSAPEPRRSAPSVIKRKKTAVV
jgi:hypothetical protein